MKTHLIRGEFRRATGGNLIIKSKRGVRRNLHLLKIANVIPN